jgi:RNA polymerase sigma-70 factor (ECF subfamily)
MGLCLHLLGKREDAEDAAAEVFMRLRMALDRYDDSRPFEPWLTGVVVRHCLDRLRRRRRERRLFESEPEEPVPSPGEDDSPLAGLLAQEQRAAVNSAITTLPERQRLALVLRYHGEMSYDEIAERLDWSRQRVAVTLFRARQALRRALGPGRTAS